jgi:polyhydroxyalkanoate synthase
MHTYQAVSRDHPARSWDMLWHASMARTFQPLSPGSVTLAYTDWLTHLQMYPARQNELAVKHLKQWIGFGSWFADQLLTVHRQPFIDPQPHDTRFRDNGWRQWPFNVINQTFLLQQNWWQDVTSNVRGIHPHHEKLVNFLTRQVLDMCAPSNFLLTNPRALRATAEQAGDNLGRGVAAFADDVQRFIMNAPPRGAEQFPIGKRLATTPGKVVYRNELIELIQYSSATPKVKPEPLLLVPAWIMKYYILDLSPENSLVRYLVHKGYTVFIISWKNQGAQDRNIGFDDYRKLGVMSALDAISVIVPDQKIHSVGYCIGRTLLSVAAAHMARVDDQRLATMTLFTALTDFSDPGELGLFTDPSQLTYLEDLMWHRGYLSGARMSRAFYFLRSLDLIWSRYVNEYLLGEPAEMFDLMAWNADTTNLPYRMHSEYLRSFYLNNDLVEGRYMVDNEPVMLLDIRLPIFAVGTTRDHVAPWKSVYRINRLTRTNVEFLLTTGGHNAGVVNPPGPTQHEYQIHSRRPDDKCLPAATFHKKSQKHPGSWWPEWERWMLRHSGEPIAPPAMGAENAGYPVLMEAPGSYVHATARNMQMMRVS